MMRLSVKRKQCLLNLLNRRVWFGKTLGLLTAITISACSSSPTPTVQPTKTPEPTRTLVSPTAPPALTATATPMPATSTPTLTPIPVFATAKENLNIRKGPTASSQILGQLKKGESVQILGRTAASDWWQIALPPDPTVRGWISAAFTTANGPIEGIAILQENLSPTPPGTATQMTAPQPTASSTLITLLSPPQLVQPQTRASFAANAPVVLTWTWERLLGPDEYFEVQLSREGTEPKDFACTAFNVHTISQAPLGYGWYQWRILVRRGRIQGDQCTAQNDVSRPSEIRTFEWRLPVDSPQPTPAVTQPPTPTRGAYP